RAVTVTGAGSRYFVIVTGIGGEGTVGLNLVDDGSIRDLAGNRLVKANAGASFAAQTAVATGPSPSAVVVADLDGNGASDLVVANGDTNTVSVLLGSANGTCTPPQTFTTGMNPRSVAVADVNGDGVLDLITADS